MDIALDDFRSTSMTETVYARSTDSASSTGSQSTGFSFFAGDRAIVPNFRLVPRDAVFHVLRFAGCQRIDPDLGRILEQGIRLSLLPPDWDSFGGEAIPLNVIKESMSWLMGIYRPGMPEPSIVPGSDGSVQVEWHVNGVDLEVLFGPDGESEVFFDSGDKEEILALDDVPSFEPYIESLIAPAMDRS